MRSVEMLASWARLLPLFAALLLALPGVGGGASFFYCHGMDRVVDACCCPSDTTALPTARGEGCGAKVQPRDCCERIERGSANVTAAARETAGLVAALPATLVDANPVVVRAAAPSERRAVPEPVEARAPRPRGPPLFLAHCSFLT